MRGIKPMFSAKAAFLIFAAGLTFRLSVLEIVLLIFGYMVFDNLDQWRVRRLQRQRIQKVIGQESEWEKNPNDPQWETQNGFTRIRLPQNEQIVVTRVAEIFSKLYIS
jgi:hypothetical protein